MVVHASLLCDQAGLDLFRAREDYAGVTFLGPGLAMYSGGLSDVIGWGRRVRLPGQVELNPNYPWHGRPHLTYYHPKALPYPPGIFAEYEYEGLRRSLAGVPRDAKDPLTVPVLRERYTPVKPYGLDVWTVSQPSSAMVTYTRLNSWPAEADVVLSADGRTLVEIATLSPGLGLAMAPSGLAAALGSGLVMGLTVVPEVPGKVFWGTRLVRVWSVPALQVLHEYVLPPGPRPTRRRLCPKP